MSINKVELQLQQQQQHLPAAFSLRYSKVFVFHSPLYVFFSNPHIFKTSPFFPTRHTNLKAMNLSLSQQRRIAWHAWLVHCHCYGFMISDRLHSIYQGIFQTS